MGEEMELTHFDKNGHAIMVDVTEKADTVREATAAGKIRVSKEVYEAVEQGTVKKGDVLSVAATAGIMGAKKTSDLIPMCHILGGLGCVLVTALFLVFGNACLCIVHPAAQSRAFFFQIACSRCSCTVFVEISYAGIGSVFCFF